MNIGAESIWREFSANLDRFIRSRVADAATAEDILQEVFLKLQSRLDEFRDPTKLKGWLFLVARNAIIDHYRTRKNTAELTESLPAEWSEHETEENGTEGRVPSIASQFAGAVSRGARSYRVRGVDAKRTRHASGHFHFRRQIARATGA